METNDNKMVSFLMSPGKDIKGLKATLVGGALEKAYRRAIEDICERIESYEVDVKSKFLSIIPSSLTTNDVVTSGFDADAIMKVDIEAGIKTKKDIDYLEVFLDKYTKHFGAFENMALIEKVAPAVASKYKVKEA